LHRRLMVGHKLRVDTPLLKKRRGPSHVCETITLRLQPVRRIDRIVFMDRGMIFDEVGHICLTAFHGNRELFNRLL
jgi:hypothetical protein